MNTKIIATLGLALTAICLPALAQASDQPVSHARRYQATATRVQSGDAVRHRKVYYGVGFGDHHRTTLTGGNAGGYSDRN